MAELIRAIWTGLQRLLDHPVVKIVALVEMIVFVSGVLTGTFRRLQRAITVLPKGNPPGYGLELEYEDPPLLRWIKAIAHGVFIGVVGVGATLCLIPLLVFVALLTASLLSLLSPDGPNFRRLPLAFLALGVSLAIVAILALAKGLAQRRVIIKRLRNGLRHLTCRERLDDVLYEQAPLESREPLAMVALVAAFGAASYFGNLWFEVPLGVALMAGLHLFGNKVVDGLRHEWLEALVAQERQHFHILVESATVYLLDDTTSPMLFAACYCDVVPRLYQHGLNVLHKCDLGWPRFEMQVSAGVNQWESYKKVIFPTALERGVERCSMIVWFRSSMVAPQPPALTSIDKPIYEVLMPRQPSRFDASEGQQRVVLAGYQGSDVSEAMERLAARILDALGGRTQGASWCGICSGNRGPVHSRLIESELPDLKGKLAPA